MSTPLLSNATLLKISAGGGAEDYDASALAPVDKWSGVSPCFYRLKRRMTPMGERLEEEYILVDANLTAIEPGDTLQFSYNNLTMTRTVHDARDESWGSIVVAQELLVT